MSDIIDYWIGQAHKLAVSTGKPMQVIYSDHGGYQVFPASCKVGPMTRIVYITNDGEQPDEDDYDFLR